MSLGAKNLNFQNYKIAKRTEIDYKIIFKQIFFKHFYIFWTKKCHNFILLDHDFGPKLVENEKVRTTRFGFKKFMVKAICLHFTTSSYLV